MTEKIPDDRIISHKYSTKSLNSPVMLRITVTAITPLATVIKTAFNKVSKYSFDSRARTYSMNAKI